MCKADDIFTAQAQGSRFDSLSLWLLSHIHRANQQQAKIQIDDRPCACEKKRKKINEKLSNSYAHEAQTMKACVNSHFDLNSFILFLNLTGSNMHDNNSNCV